MRMTRRAKRRLLFVIAIAVLGTAAALVVTALQSSQRNRVRLAHRADGLQAFSEGRMEETLEHLSVVVQYDKQDVDVLLAFAEARSQLPLPNRFHLHEARVYYESALKLVEEDSSYPNRDAIIRNTLTKLLEVRGQLGETFEMERVAERLLADDPNDIEALTAKVSVCVRDRRFEEGLPIAKKLASLEPGALRWLHLQLQMARSMRALDSDLIAQCDEWIESYQGDGRMHLLKAAWLYELGYLDRGKAEIETAVGKGASSLEVLQQMLSLLGSFHRHDLIATVIEKTRADYPHAPWARHAIIEYTWQTGQVSEAMAELLRAKEELSELPIEIRRDEVLLMLAANRLDEARNAFETYRKLVETEKAGPSDRALVIALAARLSQTKLDWPMMLSRFDEALAIAPDEPVVHFLRGEVCAKVGEHALAATSFGRASTIEPMWIAAAVAQADSLLSLGRAERAFEVSRAAAQRSPRSNLAPLLTMARAALALNQSRNSELEGVPTFETEEQFMQESARNAAAGIDLPGMLLAIQQQLPEQSQVFSLLIEAMMQVGRVSDAQQRMHAWLSQPTLNEEQLIVAAELVRRYDLGSRPLLERKLREYRGSDPRITMSHAWLLLDAGDAKAGIDVVDRFFADAPPEVTAGDALQLARVSFLISANNDSAWPQLRELIDRYPRSVPVQTYALGQPSLWEEKAMIEKIISNLSTSLGDRSQQVRLANASFLLRFSGEKEEDRAKAVVIVQSVLEETPSSLVALTLLADAYLQGEKPMYEQAVDALQSAIDAHPREVSLYPRFIALLQQLGRFDDAQEYLAQLGALRSADPHIARMEVELLLTQGSFEAALLRAMSFITEHSPPPDQLLLAAMLGRTGQADKAQRVYEQLLADPASAKAARGQAAEFFAKQGDFARGFALLGEALKDRDENEGEQEVLLGWFCYRHGKPYDAVAHFERAIEVAPKSADAWHALGRYHLSRGAFADAERIAREGMKKAGEDDRLRADFALAEAGQSPVQWRESLSRMALQTGDVPALLATLDLASEVSADAKDPDRETIRPSTAQFTRARTLLEQYPRFLPAWYLAIAINANAREMVTATEFARSAMSRFPNQPAPAEWATRLFLQNARWNDALSAAEEWNARTPNDPIAARCAIATSLLKLDRADTAVERLGPLVTDILAQREAHPENAMVLIDTFLAAGKAQALIDAAGSMLSEPAWRMRWAFSARTAQPSVTALVLQELDAAISSDDGSEGSPEELLGLAAEWQQLGDRANERRWLERGAALAEAVKSQTDDAPLKTAAEFILATIDESMGNKASAEARYRNVLRDQPNHALALNNLAYLLHTKDAKDADALQLARKAAELMPASPDVLDTLGVVLLASGRPAEAETQLRKALSSRPNDMNIGLNLVDAIIHQQKFDEASRELEQLQRTLRTLPGRGVEYSDRVRDMRKRIAEQVTVAEPS